MENLRVRASRVGALFGVDPRCSALVLYYEMRGEIGEREGDEAINEGRFLEEGIAQIAAAKFGLDIRQPSEFGCTELGNDLIVGHPDRLFIKVGRLGILEIKHTFDGGGEHWADGLPPYYWFQAHTYGWLLKEKHPDQAEDYAIVGARLKGGTQEFRVDLDAAVWDETRRRAAAFIERCRAGNPPDPASEADQRIRWLARNEAVVEAQGEQIGWALELRRQGEIRRAAEKAEEQLKELLLGWARDNGVVTATDRNGVLREIVALKAQKRFDAEAFSAEHPAIAAQFQKLDPAALKKHDPRLYEQFQRLPESPLEQTRTIRLLKALEDFQ
jgi:hypothetical protein